ncbi:DUF3833 domain-containing protein [Actibacterium lipolyticum]|uniref:DUF3833 domain-containing protein n=1 Tax=Actibacterium lipolyticum TaxID=1524263 RepID=A0A238KRM3_9RHOB|nr:DUF3833 domain-containing protein [Actibacterium lipolyticum]SMX44772.1 hypothetical protein COL8621_02629 [Actibacterium lipolyticum]
MTLLIAICVALLLYLAQMKWLSFSAQTPQDYSGTAPGFDIRTHLAGPLKSEGVIFGPTGRVAGRFIADMNGDWNGDTGTLSENFRYATGGQQNRQWRITMGEAGAFTATADDVIGIAHGQHAGATVRMTYRLKLDQDAGGHVLNVVDWLYLMEDGSIMNKSEMRKFGIKVAELIATMRPAHA